MSTDAECRAVARQNLNTLWIGPRGHVWVRFLSPREHPIGRVRCTLMAGGRTWPEQKTSVEGEVHWDDLPLRDFTVRMSLATRSLDVPVPWLRTCQEIHIERLHDAEARQLLGPDDCPFSIQVRLNGLGYDCGAVDGNIGPRTKEAARLFQSDRGLVVDGIPGPATQSYLTQAFDGTEAET